MSKIQFTRKSNYVRCKNSALYSLAMREHSRQELLNKLLKKEFVEKVDLDKLLNDLEHDNYLSDERFTESFIRYRSTRGQGPIKIINELRQRGVNGDLINEAMDNSDINWNQIAQDQLDKKYSDNSVNNYKDKVKRMRFLNSRGFSSDIIREFVS